ncbi:phosphoglycerate mutase-like protein [Violaceomyces palustris]|uniref:Phosphoglycerate mutase-like protein n=1 Tax=Violaceomyces palustris TaxID=1673888 RepID=A0ACD0NRU0_9BASI|nr:phosphoglycerate mutase-like protein [Violaceomyces palustris]
MTEEHRASGDSRSGRPTIKQERKKSQQDRRQHQQPPLQLQPQRLGGGPLVSLVRHAESVANVAKVLQGVTDSNLTVHGNSQVQAVSKAFALSLPVRNRSSSPDGVDSDLLLSMPPKGVDSIQLPPPTEIFSSPIGRAKKTADSIAHHCNLRIGSARVLPLPNSRIDDPWPGTVPGLEKIFKVKVDPGLSERDFGTFESTRSRTHVAGFEKGKGRGESKEAFQDRVSSVGKRHLWEVMNEFRTVRGERLQGLSKVNENKELQPLEGKDLELQPGGWRQEEEEVSVPGEDLDMALFGQKKRSRSTSSGGEGSEAKRPRRDQGKAENEGMGQDEVPHRVIVTHGLWISSFFKRFPPSNVPGGLVPFAGNTGVFTLELDPDFEREADSAEPKYKLIRSNYLDHLAHVRRQGGGIGSSEADPRQSKLFSFGIRKS